ncbi:Malate dehydrogenase (oxaloacetate-decarboxylating) (NADP(+)) [Ascochyta rabiei]|uniref:Malic enzyme n=1 Tax=Didymella rabiei TaxID=5454 RepID=A0A163C9H2_DIDRA|nr:Malate dehydrogenase (oxaloacetate-decarboxylating) (NADP(+)) [Ascochyta rabiei]KZM22301.1 malate dehydrogenase (decarboxylating) (NAD+) [Ascochyta rabiei]UPX09498.1 Malate dehydrogenase (oxaloacetate-decarboxylating) (NADP(+)) [Ascochyta rabiei]
MTQSTSNTQRPVATRQLTTTSGDFCQSNSPDVRKHLGTYGLTPPAVESYDVQAQRCLRLLAMKATPLEKFQYLTHLKASNVHLFYRLLSQNIKELTPLIYTPTVGEACVRWHEIWTQPEGMYLSFSDRGNLRQILDNWPHDVDITVLTDGSRILGLGDLGVNGMGIPVGKLSLYTACAGIRPEATLPLTLDLGTNNKALREDPLYMGSRLPKVTAEEEKEFLDELMAALTDKWPNIVIQFEDFKNPFPALERYQNTYSMFNDDVQGTGAVIVGGFINAVKASGVPVKDHKAIFLGAGSAGVGVAKQIVEFFKKEGLTEEEARRKFWFVDSNGLVTHDRGDKLAEHKVYFARDDNNGRQYQSLARLIDYVQPTILMGLSTIGGAFNKEILQKMAKLNNHPVIFPLSNPSSKSECTFEEAVLNTEGRCLFASGSPFPSMEYNGKLLTPGQGNNMYVFPGIGLGAILSKATSVTQDMIYASAESLSTSLNKQEVADGWLYPDIRRIREVSVVVTRGVIRAAQQNGVDRASELRDLSDEELDAYIVESMYNPFKDGEQLGEEVAQLVAQTNGVNGVTNGVTHSHL